MKKCILIFMILLPTILFGQKEAATWYFGYGGLDFNCNPPNPLTPNKNFGSVEGTASISDSLGNLLFYTDGNKIYDRSHGIMQNGKNIGLDSTCYGSSTQGALILKKPQQDSIYYIFTTDCAENYLANGFNYSIVNMKLNNGMGAVTLKKQKLINKVCEKVAAVKHANGNDIWILTHEWGNDKFYSYLLTNSGLITVPVISSCGRIQLPLDTTINYPECAARGALKFSTQGDKVVVISTSDCHSFVAYPEIFSFDNAAGILSYKYSINTNDSIRYYGASFSPDGNLLYISSGWYGRFIHQFDLSTDDSIQINNSKYIVYLDTVFLIENTPCALQIGPDAKIYNAASALFLNTINNPNNKGTQCNFSLNSILLDTCPHSYSKYGLPNYDESIFLTSFIGAPCIPVTIVDFQYQDSCAGTPINFKDNSNFYPLAINNWYWDFGDPATGVLNNSSQKNPIHTFSNSGIFKVKLVATSDKNFHCKVDSIEKYININCIQGYNEHFLSNDIHVFPIPATNYININYKEIITEVHIHSTDGKLVTEKIDPKGINKIEFNLNDGIYIMILKNKKTIITKKISINNYP